MTEQMPEAAMPGMMGQAQDAKGVIASLEENIPPEQQDQYERLVAAGMKIMFHEKTRPFVQKFLDSGDEPVTKSVKGAMALLGILYQESTDKPSLELIVPVGLTLMLEAMDFLAQKGDMEFSMDAVADGTEMFIDNLMTQMGVSNEQVQSLMAEAQQAQQMQQGGVQ